MIPNTLLLLPLLAIQPKSFVFGHTALNAPLTGWTVGSGKDVRLIMGGIHGDEGSPPGVVRKLMAYVVDHPALQAGKTFVFIPESNPDGIKARTRTNANGVDVNRNFPEGWEPQGRGMRYNPGPKPLSEPESVAFRDLFLKLHPRAAISIHSPLNCVNWDGDGAAPLAAVMAKYNGMVVKDSIGYPTPGSLGHFCATNKIPLITLELKTKDPEVEWSNNTSALVAFLTYVFPSP